MARVPIARNLVQQQPVTDAKFRAFDTGAEAIGEGVRDLGRSMGQVAKDWDGIEAVHDETDARQNDLQHIEGARLIRQKVRQAQGVYAEPARVEAEKEYASLNKTLIEKARSPRAKALLEASIARRTSMEMGALDDYATGETQKYVGMTLDARIKEVGEEARDHWDNPVARDTNIATGLGEVSKWAKWHGIPEDSPQFAAKKREFLSGVHSGVAQQLITNGRDDDARNYIQQHREEIGHEAEIALINAYRPTMLRRDGAAIVDGLLGNPAAPATNDNGSTPAITWRSPVPQGGTPTNGFNAPRPGGRLHHADDIAGKPGTPVYAAADGRVTKTWSSATEGNVVEVTHPGGWRSTYAHFEQGGVKAKVGDAVDASTPIGGIGNAGRSSGPHVHVSVFNPKGERVDPRKMYGTTSAGGANPGGAPTGQRINYGKQYAAIKAMGLTPDLEDAALTELKSRVSEEDMVRGRREADAQRALESHMVNMGGGDKITRLDQIPASIRMALPPGEMLQLQEMIKRNTAPKAVEANGRDALTLTLEAIYEPEKFKARNLGLEAGKLTRGELESLAVQQAKMRTNGGDKQGVSIRGDITSAIGLYSSADKSLDAALDKGKKPENFMRVFKDMEATILSQTEGKRNPTDAELEGAFKKATMKVIVPGRVYGTNERPRFEVEAGARSAVSVPGAVRDRIIASWKRNYPGRVMPDGWVGATYVEHKGKPGFW